MRIRPFTIARSSSPGIVNSRSAARPRPEFPRIATPYRGMYLDLTDEEAAALAQELHEPKYLLSRARG
jgi:hypothetical protein